MIPDLLAQTHDLRNKMVIITGNLEYVRTNNTQPDLKKPIENIVTAVEFSAGILDRIGDLLSSKQDLDKMTLKRVNEHIEEIRKDVLGPLQRLFDIKLTVHKDRIDFKSHVLNNDELFSQVYENIIENAHQNGASKVAITYEDRPKRLNIIFEDNGKGIKPEHLNKIGTGFSTKEGSHGLGTQIAIENIKKLKGKISWMSDGASGTAVKIELPSVKK